MGAHVRKHNLLATNGIDDVDGLYGCLTAWAAPPTTTGTRGPAAMWASMPVWHSTTSIIPSPFPGLAPSFGLRKSRTRKDLPGAVRPAAIYSSICICWSASKVTSTPSMPKANENFRIRFGGEDTVVSAKDTTVRWLATLRGRFGYVWDRRFLYATGGLAFGDVHSSVDATRTRCSGRLRDKKKC